MKRILIATVIGLSVLSAGCTGGGTTGEAKPDPTSGGSTSAGGSSKLDSIKPCDLLTESEATSLGYKTPGEHTKLGSADTCDWKLPGKAGTVAGIRTKTGVKDLTLKGRISDVKVGQFSAKKVEAGDEVEGSCGIMLSVTETSSISIITTMTGPNPEDTAGACDLVSQVADLVVKKLS